MRVIDCTGLADTAVKLDNRRRSTKDAFKNAAMADIIKKSALHMVCPLSGLEFSKYDGS